VGAIVTSLLFSAGKHLFSLYLGRTALVSIYGAAGSVFVILIWVYFSTAILLLGAEFTCVYAERHGHDVVPKSRMLSGSSKPSDSWPPSTRALIERR
jgi:membrane protein